MMMTLIHLLILSLLQFIVGWLSVHHFGLREKSIVQLFLAWLTGIGLCSILPLILELAFIPLSLFSIYGALLGLILLLRIGYGTAWADIKKALRESFTRMYTIEWLYLLPVVFLFLLSAWRCYYTAPTARDFIVGAELLSEFAVREGQIVSSVFTDNIRMSSNNPFKPPFLLNLQIVYKLIGFSFGKIWLSKIVLCFLVILYQFLRDYLHPFLASLLLLIFMAIPDMYAYTFIVLYDYSNAVFFSLSVFFLIRYLKEDKKQLLYFSSFLMGIACLIRAETFFFACLAIPLLFMFRAQPFFSALKHALVFLSPSILVHVVWFNIFITFYLPSGYPIAEQFKAGIPNLAILSEKLTEIWEMAISGNKSRLYYAHFFDLFMLVSLANFLIWKKLRPWRLLYMILVSFLAYAFLAGILPLIEVENTVKRGLFKIFPLMLMYMAMSSPLQWLSLKISGWESPGHKSQVYV